jgi:hypothetical protein
VWCQAISSKVSLDELRLVAMDAEQMDIATKAPPDREELLQVPRPVASRVAAALLPVPCVEPRSPLAKDG